MARAAQPYNLIQAYLKPAAYVPQSWSNFVQNVD
jgi:hypothetical protein